ncbi:hypothetical protein PFISCL1PPCAC_487, partial [Pristionchus fissidentatus]
SMLGNASSSTLEVIDVEALLLEDELLVGSLNISDDPYEGNYIITQKLFDTVYYGYMPFCVIMGMIGNCLAWLLIRYNRTLKQIPSNLYLLTLAGMSSLFLLSLLIFWLEQVSFLYPEYFESYVIHQ